jgi:hypothetical protein
MKLNIFRIELSEAGALKSKLGSIGLTSIKELDLDGWKGQFLFSQTPSVSRIPWIATFADYFENNDYFNHSYFAVLLLQSESSCYAICFGKAHFYVRPYCDFDFGIELSKRIANEDDITQTSARRFQGKQKKDIRSFGAKARLNIPPGESVDFIQAAIIPSKTSVYGGRGKFGVSALLSPTIKPKELGSFLSQIEADFAAKERFTLPRTILLSEGDEVKRYDEKRLDELTAPVGTSEISTETFDLYGVDFIFSSQGSFTLKCGHYKAVDLDQLTMKDVKAYIAAKGIPREKILQMKVTHHREGEPSFTQHIKEAIDFISDDDRVVLTGGKWLKFNQDYLDYLDESVRQVQVEDVEPDFLEIEEVEGDFNSALLAHGYDVADKDFSIFSTRSSTPVEAWDLRKGDTVYAVKFGTPQKLNYVCDQAMAVLELMHNRANVRKVPQFSNYCLWLGYRAKKLPASIADSGSIILKQKIYAWAVRCEELGITPRIKLSRKINPKYDASHNSEESPQDE